MKMEIGNDRIQDAKIPTQKLPETILERASCLADNVTKIDAGLKVTFLRRIKSAIKGGRCEEEFVVQSQFDVSKSYKVRVLKDSKTRDMTMGGTADLEVRNTCTCEDHLHRQRDCKHIVACQI